MNSIAIGFVIINFFFLLFLPRRLAPLPLLMGVCYMTYGQGVEVGPFNFTVIRILIAIGILRIIVRGERINGDLNQLDLLMLAWATVALSSSLFKFEVVDALIFRLGLVYNTCGAYFLIRIFCVSINDLKGLVRIIAIILIPIALEMIYEQLTSHNLFSILGGVPFNPDFRSGNIRAQGPFAHSILAGTVGSVCLPFMIGIWQHQKKVAIAGSIACIIIVFASSSSGPILSTLVVFLGFAMWHWRQNLRALRWAAILGYFGLELVMKAPAYYLIARVAPVGGSTGYHRAQLIESALDHLSEWWLFGTDYTRHWMATGVSWSADHTDITNHYIKMGVLGGLPLMILFIAIIYKGFSFIGKILKNEKEKISDYEFFIWGFGVSLFAHAATCISVSYFDQSFIFLYLTLAAIGSTWSHLKYAENAITNQIVDKSTDTSNAVHV